MEEINKTAESNVVEFPQGSKNIFGERVRFRHAFFSFFVVATILTVVYLSTPLSRLGVIYFDGLNVLTRSELISLLDVDYDDFFWNINMGEIREVLDEHPVVQDVRVRRALLNRIRISVVEYEVGSCALIDGELHHILVDGTVLHEDSGLRANCARMMIYGLTETELEEGIASLFVRQLMRVEPQIRDLIEVIEHEPRFGDNYRFSLTMLDGNTVKVTTHTMPEQLNLYREIIEGLMIGGVEVGQTGIINLDVGDVFQPH